MSKKIDIKIKESYESLSKTAPHGLWNKISKGLDTQGTESKLNEKIKDSFKSQYKKAPGSIWGNISGDLIKGESDLKLNKKIKESYEIQNSSAPINSWNKIKRQLIIDRTWKRLNNQLNMKDIYRIIKYAAVILLLISIGFTGIRYFTEENPINENYITKNHENNITDENKEVVPEQKSKEEAGYDKSKYELNDNGNFIARNDKNITQLSNNHENTVVLSSDTLNDINKNVVQTPNKLLAVAEIKKIDQKNISRDIVPTKDINNPVEVQTDVKETSRSGLNLNGFEFGLTYSYENTIINNNDNRLGADKYSFTKTVDNYEHVFALAASYSFNKKNTLSTGIHFNSKEGQKVSKYNNGHYYDKNLTLNYLKIDLYYQRNLLTEYSIPFNVIIGLGGYYSHLKEAKEKVDNTTYIKNNEFRNYDYGVNGILGLRNESKRFIIEYGVKAEYGFNNIFSGNEKISSEFNYTSIINYGAFLNIKIKLTKTTFRFQPLAK